MERIDEERPHSDGIPIGDHADRDNQEKDQADVHARCCLARDDAVSVFTRQ